jgi:hypothetical protein
MPKRRAYNTVNHFIKIVVTDVEKFSTANKKSAMEHNSQSVR